MALTINQQIVAYASGNIGTQVGDGECWTLAEKALAQAGAQTSNDIMGASKVTPNADYVWGDKIAFKDITPGDILQFRDYVMTTRTVVSVFYKNLPAGVTIDPNPADESDNTETFDQNHHTAIAAKGYDNKLVAVLQQNVPPDGKKVQEATLAVDNIAAKSTVTNETRTLDAGSKKITLPVAVTTTVTVTVKGTIWAYRPKKK
ncbi:MAG: hypothetical protein FIA97_01005 [Methylococcaceae bacterium]|nr:hypothetical protein [Methylococcaceae bacterium]